MLTDSRSIGGPHLHLRMVYLIPRLRRMIDLVRKSLRFKILPRILFQQYEI